MNQHFLLHLYELKQLNLENLLSLWLVKCFCEIGPSLQDATTWSWGPSAAFLLGFSHHQANFFEQTANLKVLSSQKFINSIFSKNKISFYTKNRNTPASFLITMYLHSGTQTRVCQMQCKHATTLPFHYWYWFVNLNATVWRISVNLLQVSTNQNQILRKTKE